MGGREVDGNDSLYKEIFSKSPVGILFYDKEGNLLDANPSALKIAGVAKLDDLKCLNLFENPYLAPLKEKLINGGIVKFQSPIDFENIRKIGYFDSNRSKTGYLDYIISVTDFGFLLQIQDITECIETEDELRQTHSNLEEQVKKRTEEVYAERKQLFDVLETLPVMIVLLKPDYHVNFANRAFREKFGESKGRHCYEYCCGFAEPCVFCESFKPLETGKPHRWEFTSPDGETIIDAYDFPFTDIDGSPLILEMDVDISKQRHAEKELKETIKELNRSNEELQSFAYITSHDLQEPLRTIASYAQLIERRYEGKLDSDADDFIEFMVDGASRMKEMIQGLLDYSRVGVQGHEFTEFNAEIALNYALNNLGTAISEVNAEITSDELPVIYADENQIIRVFQNLVGNAIKFRKEGIQPKIHISAKKKDNEYIFSINDNGIGLEEQYSDKIFEVFKRLHAIGEYQGAGIGLAIVKRIIDRHGGRIWVKSKLGVGSTFYFTIPIKNKT